MTHNESECFNLETDEFNQAAHPELNETYVNNAIDQLSDTDKKAIFKAISEEYFKVLKQNQ